MDEIQKILQGPVKDIDEAELIKMIEALNDEVIRDSLYEALFLRLNSDDDNNESLE